jgi:Ca2+-binding RTX toxin-like protein
VNGGPGDRRQLREAIRTRVLTALFLGAVGGYLLIPFGPTTAQQPPPTSTPGSSSTTTTIPGSAAIHGVVYGGTVGNPLAGAWVSACRTTGFPCQFGMTDNSGGYAFANLAAGDYVVRVYPPANANFNDVSVAVNGLGAAEVRQADIVLPAPELPPPGVTITPSRVAPSGVPVVYWHDPLRLRVPGCAGGTATWEVRQGGAVIPGYSGPMTEGPAGIYTATIPPLFPHSGAAKVVVTIVCPGGGTVTVKFDIYIDPSGFVRNTFGVGIVGATVTLFRSDTSGGPFVQVPNNDPIMSPANRTNPDLTDPTGHFGWDVIAGYYKVTAARTGCHAPGNPGQPTVETAELTIPPPVTDLELVLECAPPPCTITGSSGNDTLNGTPGDDVICALGGNDIVNGRGGNDTIFLGPGNDTLRLGGTGHVAVYGDSGTDTIDFRSALGAETLDLVTRTGTNTEGGTVSIALDGPLSSIENVIGTPHADVIRGDGGPNVLDGNARNDVLDGRGGNDTLLGNTGQDVLIPGPGNDVVNDGSDVNTISYADLTGGVGVSINFLTGQVTGGSGTDTFTPSAVWNAIGSPYDDTIVGNGANNVLSGLEGNDTISGGNGNDTINGGPGTDSCDGGPGTNVLVDCP